MPSQIDVRMEKHWLYILIKDSSDETNKYDVIALNIYSIDCMCVSSVEERKKNQKKLALLPFDIEISNSSADGQIIMNIQHKNYDLVE